MCETTESLFSKNIMGHGFVYQSFTKERMLIYTTIVFQLSMIPYLYHDSTKKKFTLLANFFFFVVSKINKGELTAASSDEKDEVIMTRTFCIK